MKEASETPGHGQERERMFIKEELKQPKSIPN